MDIQTIGIIVGAVLVVTVLLYVYDRQREAGAGERCGCRQARRGCGCDRRGCHLRSRWRGGCGCDWSLWLQLTPRAGDVHREAGLVTHYPIRMEVK
jgi:hypothetical protein